MERSAGVKFEADLDAMFKELGGGRAAAAPGSAAVKEPPKQAARTVLVVDDNKDYRELVKHLLAVNHYTVKEAGDGEEAMKVINASPPDLVLADFNMPRMNGYELIQEIRSNYELRKLRIIMFTGAANRQHLKTLNMDISDFLEKPVPNARLLDSIARALGGWPAAARPQPKPQPAPQPAEQPRPKIELPPPEPEPQPRPEEPPPDIEPEPIAITIERFAEPARTAVPPYQPARPAPQEPPPAAPQPRIELPPEAEAAFETPAPPPAQEEPAPAPEPEEVVPEIDEVLTEDAHDLEMIDEAAEAKKEESNEAVGIESLTQDSPLVQMVNKILVKAVEMRASDIHMEPSETRVVVRVRVDGVLHQLTTLPISIHPRLTARVKIMSNLVITERRIPQDGQFRVQIKGQKIEFRVSTLPCVKGEKIVMRILGQSKLNSDLSRLDMTPRELKKVEAVLKSPHGLILVTGPTGSGKTTTLYTMINVLNKPEVNIMTAEDPVEYEVPSVNQVKINPIVGLTFESTLRAFLRQDPDIMLVGEIRDLETAEIAIKASITGHLVFSTLHTNSAPATVVRLTHMGVASYLVAASVKMVIAQRLVRTLCPHCRAKVPLPDDERKFLTDEEAGRLQQVWRPAGCARCRGSGYTGRKPLFEVMPLESSAMRQLITSNFNVDMLSDLAIKEGMTTLRQSALAAVAHGTTSMQEALKIMMG